MTPNRLVRSHSTSSISTSSSFDDEDDFDVYLNIEDASSLESVESVWRLCEQCTRKQEELEEGMRLFTEWTATEEEASEEVSVEPEEPVCLTVALPWRKQLLPTPSADMLRALSSPDLLMDSLAVLLFETRHLHFVNERMALPPPPKWMVAAMQTEMDPPNTATTVSLPSGWDAVSARLSTSSIFNLFSDRVATPIPSLFSIDPTGLPSTASTVSVPASFWDTASTVSVTGPAPSSAVSIPSAFFNPPSSSASSLFPDPSEVSSEMDLPCPADCAPTDSDYSHLTSSSSSSHLGLCNATLALIHRRYAYSCGSSNDVLNKGFIVADDVSGASSGYDTDVDSEPMVLATTVSETAQTDELLNKASAAQMLAECEELLEKLQEMKKKLKELL